MICFLHHDMEACGAFAKALLAGRRDDLEILSEPRPLPFDAAGNLGELGDEG